MNIILKNLPENISDRDIEDFIIPAIQGGLFRRRGMLQNVTIYKHIILPVNTTEYYALVMIEPDSAARHAMVKLQRQKIHGRFIRLNEFYDRHWSHERRRAGGQIDTSMRGKRRGERRRKRQIVVLSGTTASVDFFNQADYHVWDDFYP